MSVHPWSLAKTSMLVAAFLALALAGPAQAQAGTAVDAYDGWDNAYYQILAENLRRASQRQWAYTSDAYRIGRIVDVRTSPDGMHDVALIRVRRPMGGGVLAMPIHRLARLGGRIVSQDDRAAVLAIGRPGVPGTGAQR